MSDPRRNPHPFMKGRLTQYCLICRPMLKTADDHIHWVPDNPHQDEIYRDYHRWRGCHIKQHGTCPSCGGYIQLHGGYIPNHRPRVQGTPTPEQKKKLNSVCLRGQYILPTELAPFLFLLVDLGE